MYKDDNETIASILALALIFFFVSFLIATSDQQKSQKEVSTNFKFRQGTLAISVSEQKLV